MKRDKEVRYVKADMDYDNFNINVAEELPLGMGL